MGDTWGDKIDVVKFDLIKFKNKILGLNPIKRF